MANDELSERITLLEEEIERLAKRAEGCAKIITLAKVFVVLGGLVLVATLFRLIGFDQFTFIGSITAILGGIVAAGSNATTLRQTRLSIEAAERQRARLIDQLEFRPDRSGLSLH